MIRRTHRTALFPAMALLFVGGWLRAQPVTDAVPSEPVIELPALEVTAATAGARHWRYLAAPGIEVLSRCKDATTVQFVQPCTVSIRSRLRSSPPNFKSGSAFRPLSSSLTRHRRLRPRATW